MTGESKFREVIIGDYDTGLPEVVRMYYNLACRKQVLYMYSGRSDSYAIARVARCTLCSQGRTQGGGGGSDEPPFGSELF